MSTSRLNEILKLRSEDGVVFEVEGFYLMASSAVFRDMLISSAAIPRTSDASDFAQVLSTSLKDGPDTPIDVQAPSAVLGLFVHLMKHSTLPSPSDFIRSLPHDHDLYLSVTSGVKCLEAVLDLLDRFDCSVAIRERVFAYFEVYFREDPWTVFCRAARYEDLPTAQKALRAAGEAHDGFQRRKMEPSDMSVADAERVSLGWLMGYWRAYALATHYKDTSSNGAYREYKAFWTEVAQYMQGPAR